jgi:hypothetical protein
LSRLRIAWSARGETALKLARLTAFGRIWSYW